MHELAPEAFATRPVSETRHVAEPGREHDVRSGERAVRRADCPASVVAVDSLRPRPSPHFEPVPVCVFAQVAEHRVAREPAAVAARDPVAREPGEPARRMQMQPVVACAPRGAGLGAGLQHDRAHPGAPERRRGRKSGRAAADDHGAVSVVSHGPVLPPARTLFEWCAVTKTMARQQEQPRVGLIRPGARPEPDEAPLGQDGDQPTPQPERREQKLADPGLRDLSFADYKAILIRAAKEFLDDNAPLLAQALAYSTFFAIPSVLLVVVGVFTLVAGPDTINSVIAHLHGVIPSQATELLDQSLKQLDKNPSTGIVLTI